MRARVQMHMDTHEDQFPTKFVCPACWDKLIKFSLEQYNNTTGHGKRPKYACSGCRTVFEATTCGQTVFGDWYIELVEPGYLAGRQPMDRSFIRDLAHALTIMAEGKTLEQAEQELMEGIRKLAKPTDKAQQELNKILGERHEDKI